MKPLSITILIERASPIVRTTPTKSAEPDIKVLIASFSDSPERNIITTATPKNSAVISSNHHPPRETPHIKTGNAKANISKHNFLLQVNSFSVFESYSPKNLLCIYSSST